MNFYADSSVVFSSIFVEPEGTSGPRPTDPRGRARTWVHGPSGLSGEALGGALHRSAICYRSLPDLDQRTRLQQVAMRRKSSSRVNSEKPALIA